MKTVKLLTKGQIVIPKDIRESHHLAAGTEFVITFMGDEIRLKPIPVFPTTHVEEGMDFGDALHLAQSADEEGFCTFDKPLGKLAESLGAMPKVDVLRA